MSLVSVNWNPSSKDLTVFRILSAVAGVLLAIVFYALGDADPRWCIAIITVGAGIALSGFVSLRLTRCLYIGMVAVTLPIGFVFSVVLLAVVYYGLLTPLGLVFRLMGRDALRRRFDPEARSYWVSHPQTRRVDRYFQQF